MTSARRFGRKRIEPGSGTVTAFERFFAVDFDRMLAERGSPQYGEDGLSVIGWHQLAALVLFEALGEPDFRDRPWPAEQHGGWWIGVPFDEIEQVHESKPSKRNAKASAKDADLFACLDMAPEPEDPFAIL